MIRRLIKANINFTCHLIQHPHPSNYIIKRTRLQQIRNIRIYTKTGDKGTTSDYTGRRLPKDDSRIEALGSTDELSSVIGVTRAHLEVIDDSKQIFIQLISTLTKTQCALQDIGSHIATPPDSRQAEKLKLFDSKLINQLEDEIDSMTSQLPPLKAFILPGGGLTASQMHIARSVCRRAERNIVSLVREAGLNEDIGRYLNRLSDYFFTAARYISHKQGYDDTIYRMND